VMKALGSFLKYCWVLPVSCLGILLIPLVFFSGGTVSLVRGIVEAEGGVLRFLLSRRRPGRTIEALTLGHVVIGRNREVLARCRDHERIHVRQYERWGLLFPLLYLLAGAAAAVRGGDPYRDNPFEREAFGSPVGGGTTWPGRCGRPTDSQP